MTEVLRAHGEVIHPASAELASESAHWESEAAAHDLHAFHAFRRMDEIFCANYMLFDDVVRETAYDLWVGDEAWDVDHFLHENPERKIAPYAFLTDVVGFLPVDPEGDQREVELLRRLQRRDDRAPRAVPPRAGPVGVHRWLRRAAGRLAGLGAAPGARLDRAVVHQRPVRRAVRPGRLPPAAAAASRARLRHRLPALPRRGGRHRRGPGPPRAHCRGVRAGPQGGAGRPDGDGDRPAARPWAAPGRRGHGQGRLRRLALRAPGLRRPGRRPGRAVDHHGAGRRPAAVRLLPAGPPLGAAALRGAPARPLRRGRPDGLREARTRATWPTR